MAIEIRPLITGKSRAGIFAPGILCGDLRAPFGDEIRFERFRSFRTFPRCQLRNIVSLNQMHINGLPAIALVTMDRKQIGALLYRCSRRLIEGHHFVISGVPLKLCDLLSVEKDHRIVIMVEIKCRILWGSAQFDGAANQDIVS